MDDSSLKLLSLTTKQKEPIPLAPPFDKKIKEYTVTCCETEIAIQAKATEGDAFVQIAKLNNGVFTLKEGQNRAEIRVEASDGSFTLYILNIFLPNSSDANLKGLSFPQGGSLLPDFHKDETNYIVTTTSSVLTTFPLTATTLHPKSTAEYVGPGSINEIPLFIGDTKIELRVTSVDKKVTKSYFITIRKPKHIRPELTTANTAFNSVNSYCSVCANLLSHSRKTGSKCLHSFCATCLLVMQKANKYHEDPEKKSQCPLCDAAFENAVETDQEFEKSLMSAKVTCPFGKFGCQEVIEYQSLSTHLATCGYRSVVCTNCEQVCAFSQTENGKHKEECTYTCTCGRKVIKSEKDLHDKTCSSKDTATITPSSSTLPDRPWQQKLVDTKSCPKDVEACLASFANKKTCYLTSLQKAHQTALETTGASHSSPEVSFLKDSAVLLATAISYNMDKVKTKGGKIDATLHMKLALVLEESLRCAELYPPVRKTQKVEANANNEAAESAMSDEVDGLLLQLNVPATASDATKLKAMEEEYQRLLAMGLSDQAAEVQGLHTWKTKQVSKGRGQEADESSGGSEICPGGYATVLEKLKDAIDADNTTVDINYHYGRVLLKQGKPSEALTYLRKAVSLKPTFTPARFFLGSALAQTQPITKESAKEAIHYLEGGIQFFTSKLWSLPDTANQIIQGLENNELLCENIFQISSQEFCQAYLSFAKALMITGSARDAQNVLLDLLWIIPERMKYLQSRSAVFGYLEETLCIAQQQLLLSYLSATNASMTTIHNQPHRIAQILISLLNVINNISVKDKGTVLDTLENILKTLVWICPNNANFMSALGTIQLKQHEYSPVYQNDSQKLKDAENCLVMTIDLEESPGIVMAKNVQDQLVSVAEEFKLFKPALPAVAKPVAATTATKSTAAPAKAVPATKPAAKSTTAAKPAAPAAKAAPAPAKKAAPAPAKAPAPVKPAPQANKAVAKPPAPAAAAKTTTPAKPAPAKATTTPAKPTAPEQESPQEPTPSPTQQPATILTPEITQLLPITTSTTTIPATTRLNLARTLSKHLDTATTPLTALPKIITTYKSVITHSPTLHDAYIELANIIETYQKDLQTTLNIYTSYPFTPLTNEMNSKPSQDDLYLHTEIVRIIMKLNDYKNPSLITSLIAQGRAGGIACISKYVEMLDKNAENNQVLMKVFAGVNRKSLDDPEMVTLFKNRYWM